MAEVKSPIKDKPLRQPGQSLYEQLQTIAFEKLLGWYVALVFAWILAGLEWFYYLTEAPRSPVWMTIAAVALTLFAFVRGYLLLENARRVKLGMHGEQVVGQYLDGLRGKGYRVFHDLLDSDGQIDHIVVCDRGVFTVETKTASKPVRGEARIVWDGKGVSINDGAVYKAPIRQAKAQREHVRRILREITGFDYKVQPAVVYPGWFVEALPGAHDEVWVLNPKGLYKFIDSQPLILPPERVRLAVTQLSKYIRHCNVQAS